MRVVDIQRNGIGRGSGRGDVARAYLVTLRRLEGTAVRRRVLIDVALFGEGGMSLEPARQSFG